MPPKPTGGRRLAPSRQSRDTSNGDTLSIHQSPPPDPPPAIDEPTLRSITTKFGDDPKKFKEFNYDDLRDVPGAREIYQHLVKYGEDTFKKTPYDWQVEIATALALGHDMMVSVKTGGGKSLVFQLLTGMPDWNIIIISPINALIAEQLADFTAAGVPCVALPAGEKDKEMSKEWKEIDNGKYRVIVAAPERLLDQSGIFWHKMLGDVENHPMLSKVRCIFVDEAHCVHKWGKSNFRADYRGIGKLRPHFVKSVFGLMSATWSKNVRYYVHETIGLAEPTYIFRAPVKRENLSLICAEMQPGYADLRLIWETVDPELTRSIESIPKTIVYVDNRRLTQSITNCIRESLQPWLESGIDLSSDDGFSSDDETEDRWDRRARIARRRQKELERDVELAVVSFNAAQPPAEKARRLSSFREGVARIMVATEAAGMIEAFIGTWDHLLTHALGMGLNIDDVEICIQYGLTDKLGLAEVWQRLGRAARSIPNGTVIVLAEKRYIPAAPPAQYVGNVGNTVWSLSGPSGKPNFYLPVRNDTILETYTNITRIQAVKPDNEESDGLEPNLRWLLGTMDCRQNVLAAIYEDPTLGKDDNWRCGKCDNCIFPDRTYFNRAVPPPTDTRGMAAPNFRRIIRPSQVDVEMRDVAITEFITTRDTHPNADWLRRSIRYLDTCGHEQEKHNEDILRQSARDAQEGVIVMKNLPEGLKGRLVESLLRLRDTIFKEEEALLSKIMGLRVSEFLPSSTVTRVAEYVASGRPMTTLDDLDKAMGSTWDLHSSGLVSHAHKFIRVITDVTTAFRLEKEAEKAKAEKDKEEQNNRDKMAREARAQEKKEKAAIAKAARDAQRDAEKKKKAAEKEKAATPTVESIKDLMTGVVQQSTDVAPGLDRGFGAEIDVATSHGQHGQHGQHESSDGPGASQAPLAPPCLGDGILVWPQKYRPTLAQAIHDHIAARNSRSFDIGIILDLFNEITTFIAFADMIERHGFIIDRAELALDLIRYARAFTSSTAHSTTPTAHTQTPIHTTPAPNPTPIHTTPAPNSTIVETPAKRRISRSRSRNVSEAPASPFIGFAPISTPEPDAYFLPQSTEYQFTEIPTTPLRHATSRSRSQTPLPGSGRAIKLKEWDGASEKLVDMRHADADLLGQAEYDELMADARDDVLLKKTEASVASQDGARGRRRKTVQSDMPLVDSIPGTVPAPVPSIPTFQEKKRGRTRAATKLLETASLVEVETPIVPSSAEVEMPPTQSNVPSKRQAASDLATTSIGSTSEVPPAKRGRGRPRGSRNKKKG
ncbi:hypothetical protein BJ508DRAFT_314998 [Ascobolus immersus RN42]|uniref:DNA 3'-5' helicase n=1 Tax=Ascobolus immersus RN42 TaxID=1160509 RepID=A0A3N4HJJ6_ASCIM|nr:hypothetical protein BJ508DRAFT_314998 [Ascobolus immersus RN42]